jgi:two-component sensor histidine kinase
MNAQHDGTAATLNGVIDNPTRRTVLNYEREIRVRMGTEVLLREAIAHDAALLIRKDAIIEQLEILSRESDHRLLNGLQLIASLITLQSRTSANAEVAAQLAVAADRVAMIVRTHRRLHSLDGTQSVAFRQFLEDLCGDCSTMLTFERLPECAITVVGDDVDLPTATAIPLGYIVSELITNAAKYGDGRITVRLERDGDRGYALSVSSGGARLPDDFDPSASQGLGMRIILSFVDRIGGELRIGRGAKNEGAKFTVLFS